VLSAMGVRIKILSALNRKCAAAHMRLEVTTMLPRRL
jgi:hypothetical protein